MQSIRSLTLVILALTLGSCQNKTSLQGQSSLKDSTDHTEVDLGITEADSTKSLPATTDVETKDTDPESVVSYAKTLIGTPYKYGSIEPQQGFDCSGFITHVFNHFNIAVPRSSVDFTNVGTEIPVSESKPGDLILFTGTDSTRRVVGHMGIIVSNSDSTLFIHSTSGKAYGVTITPLNSYYQGRFVKTIRIFK